MGSGDCKPPPSSGSKWWWSLQSAALFVLLVAPFAFGYSVFGRYVVVSVGTVPFATVLAHAGLFLLAVRALMEQ